MTKSKMKRRVLGALRPYQAQTLGKDLYAYWASINANPWHRSRESALLENTQRSPSDAPPLSPSPYLPPPPPPPLSADTVLNSTSDIQTESSQGALRDVGLSGSDEGNEKTDTDEGLNGDGGGRDEDRTAKGATGVTAIRDSFKRTTDDIGLYEGADGGLRSEKVRRTSQSPDPIAMYRGL